MTKTHEIAPKMKSTGIDIPSIIGNLLVLFLSPPGQDLPLVHNKGFPVSLLKIIDKKKLKSELSKKS